MIFERTDGSKGQLYPVFLNFPLSRHDQTPDSLSWHSHLPQPQPSFLVRQLPPQHPAVGFCLTHKVGPPIVCPQKRDFLSPKKEIKNGLLYRIPDYAEIKILKGNKQIAYHLTSPSLPIVPSLPSRTSAKYSIFYAYFFCRSEGSTTRSVS